MAYGKLLKPGETMDAWWVRESGREAGRLLESLGKWPEAATLYEWLARELPAQQAAWRDRATRARQRWGG